MSHPFLVCTTYPDMFSKNFERCNIHHPTPFYGWHQRFRWKENRGRGYSPLPLQSFILDDMSTVDGSGNGNWQRYGVVRMRFILTLFCFSSPRDCD